MDNMATIVNNTRTFGKLLRKDLKNSHHAPKKICTYAGDRCKLDLL